jgi:hypothetical protein
VHKVIDRIAASSVARRCLAEDPLAVASAEGYAVRNEDVGAFLGSTGGPAGQDPREFLATHLRRFDRGKWYEAGYSAEPEG